MFTQVLEAAVIAVPHPKWTERPLLVVVAAANSSLSRDIMLQFLQVGSTAKSKDKVTAVRPTRLLPDPLPAGVFPVTLEFMVEPENK